MSGGKGGSTSSSVAIPEYIEAAAQRNLNKAEKISQLGYVPYYGADVAAFTPMQEAAFQNTADTASAFGTAGGNMSRRDIMGGMPAATTYANGVRGYSAAPLYEQSLQTLAEKRPGQKDYIDSFFINPLTGAPGSNVQAPIDYTSYPTGPAAPVAPTDNGGGGGGDPFDFPETTVYNPVISTGSDGTTGSWVSDQELYGAPGGHWGGADPGPIINVPANVTVDNPTGATYADPAAAAQYETNLINNPNISDDDFWDTFESGEKSGGIISGGGADGIGNLGAVGDFFGGIGDAVGVTNYDGSDEDSPSGEDGGTLVCTAMNKMGLLPDDIYALDAEYGLMVNRDDPILGDGYRLWALPVSEFIKLNTFGARTLRALMRPITLAWAKEMAHQMRPKEYKPNYAGKVIMAIGHPTCRAIGHVFLGGLAKKDV